MFFEICLSPRQHNKVSYKSWASNANDLNLQSENEFIIKEMVFELKL